MRLRQKFQKFSRQDLVSGIIVALVSIPISMGYAQIAGLPMIYGLYGSVLPIVIYALFTSTRYYVFGVDAAPAALCGSILVSLGVTAGSDEALAIVPIITFITACWLLMFWILRAGKVVQYISTPVMGGFVTGICLEIILMQIPKLYGGSAGTGEAYELIVHAIQCAQENFNLVSLLLGLATLAVILIFQKFLPAIPMQVIVMVIGGFLSVLLPLESWGVSLLPHVEASFPALQRPDLSEINMSHLVFSSLTIALVIMAETLLASKNFAMKDGEKIDCNRELLAFSLGNFASALIGCCPTNGSVSRTGIVKQFGGKSQWMSIVAAGTMIAVIAFGTPFIEYLPVPVLTAIVISALLGACDFKLGVKLAKAGWQEFLIYLAAMLGVLLLGTIYGVVIGVVLSFADVILRAVSPPRTFLGVIPGKKGFFVLDRVTEARPIKNTVIYQFSGNLFFANIDDFQNDIENAIKEDTKQVIVKAAGVGSIDVTAVDRLILMCDQLKKRGIRFIMTDHPSNVNDQIRKLGGEELLRNGNVRMTVRAALRSCGVKKPYPWEEETEKPMSQLKLATDAIAPDFDLRAEMQWAFGEDAEQEGEEIIRRAFQRFKNAGGKTGDELIESIESGPWGYLDPQDMITVLNRIDAEAMKVEKDGNTGELEKEIEEKREELDRILLKAIGKDGLTPELTKQIQDTREAYRQYLEKNDPESLRILLKHWDKHVEYLRRERPDVITDWEDGNTDDGE